MLGMEPCGIDAFILTSRPSPAPPPHGSDASLPRPACLDYLRTRKQPRQACMSPDSVARIGCRLGAHLPHPPHNLHRRSPSSPTADLRLDPVYVFAVHLTHTHTYLHTCPHTHTCAHAYTKHIHAHARAQPALHTRCRPQAPAPTLPAAPPSAPRQDLLAWSCQPHPLWTPNGIATSPPALVARLAAACCAKAGPGVPLPLPGRCTTKGMGVMLFMGSSAYDPSTASTPPCCRCCGALPCAARAPPGSLHCRTELHVWPLQAPWAGSTPEEAGSGAEQGGAWAGGQGAAAQWLTPCSSATPRQLHTSSSAYATRQHSMCVCACARACG